MASIIKSIIEVDGKSDVAVKKEFGVAKSAVLKVLQKLYTDEISGGASTGKAKKETAGRKPGKGKPGRKPGRKPKAAKAAKPGKPGRPGRKPGKIGKPKAKPGKPRAPRTAKSVKPAIENSKTF
ncbi:MAG: hypothetical protein LBC67_04210 [Spirochaetales bacterium]|jgi:hypothetical protein|nr:hypothetical protein [Spirochaetales bacterium]